MFYRRQKLIWSPVETDYLKANRETPINQLCIALSKSRNAIVNKLRELDGKPVKKSAKVISKIGKRKDLGNQFFRSGWEANVARWIKHQGQDFMYEPKVFVFDKIKHGTVSYVPDFQVLSSDTHWLEVKGMLKSSDRARIRRFKKYYPDEFNKLRAIVGAPNTAADKFFREMGVPVLYYNQINKEFKDKVAGWE